MSFLKCSFVLVLFLMLTACGSGGRDGGEVATAPDSANPPTSTPNFEPLADNGTFLSILPPGQADSNSGMGNEANFMDQLPIYERLSFTNAGELEDVDDLVPNLFKQAAFRTADSFADLTTVTDGTRSAQIGRDEFGVPHIFGETRDDVMFGTGYASAQDRMFVMDALRHVGRGRLSDFVGATAGNYAMDRDQGLIAGYDEAEIEGQIQQLATRFGATGEQIIADSDDYVAGINQYISELGVVEPIPVEYSAILQPQGPVDFTRRDVLGVATLVQATFAVGGGSEHRQNQLINALGQNFDTDTACDLWRDFRHFDDPERPNTTQTEFRTQSPPDVDEDACPLRAGFAQDFPGAAVFDNASFVARDILAIQDCFAPNVDCPDYLGTVVDNDPGTAAAPSNTSVAPAIPSIPLSPPDLSGLDSLASVGDLLYDTAIGRRLVSLQTNANLQPRVPYRAGAQLQSYTPAELAQARARIQQQLAGLQLALSGGELPMTMSNAILVNANQTQSGHPIAVFGPQTGYFVPQLLLEFSQVGGDLATRGMSFAGLPYVVIGRGVDHAWSATSAGDDIIDIRALRLCDAGVTPQNSFFSAAESGYLYNGECRAFFERVDNWTAEYHAAAQPPTDGGSVVGQAVTRSIIRAPDYGPVFARATVDGAPIALAIQRSTYFGEVDSAVPFIATGRNEMVDPESFFEVFNELTGTFNWFYIDADNIAYFNSGLLPQRAAGIHPDLPQWGDGSFDWAQTRTGELNPDFDIPGNFLGLAAHPREANPPQGYFANWNNAQAPGFYANDGQVSYGPIYRSNALEQRLIAFRDDPADPQHNVGSMVEIMGDAAHTDLRGQELVRQALAIIGDVSNESDASDLQTPVTLLSEWVANGTREFGAQRRDRDGAPLNPANLEYENRAAVVFMDTWWDAMINRALPQITAVEYAMIGGRHDLPNNIGSSFQTGYYGNIQRVLDQVLDSEDPVTPARTSAPYRALRCAQTGTFADCRNALLDSLRDTLAALGNDPAEWDGTDTANGSAPGQTREQDDAIEQSALGLATVPDIHWQNRPTFQQVVEPTQRRAP